MTTGLERANHTQQGEVPRFRNYTESTPLKLQKRLLCSLFLSPHLSYLKKPLGFISSFYSVGLLEARSHLRCVLSFPTLAASPGCWQSLQAALHGVNGSV